VGDNRSSHTGILIPTRSVGTTIAPTRSVGLLSRPTRSVGLLSRPRGAWGLLSRPTRSVGTTIAPHAERGDYYRAPRGAWDYYRAPRGAWGLLSRPTRSVGTTIAPHAERGDYYRAPRGAWGLLSRPRGAWRLLSRHRPQVDQSNRFDAPSLHLIHLPDRLGSFSNSLSIAASRAFQCRRSDSSCRISSWLNRSRLYSGISRRSSQSFSFGPPGSDACREPPACRVPRGVSRPDRQERSPAAPDAEAIR